MKYKDILEKEISVLDAYVAMTEFIREYHDFTSSTDLMDLIGGQIEFSENGNPPADIGFMCYWLEAVRKTLESEKKAIDSDWFPDDALMEDHKRIN